ncbi:hypothetical protein D3C75_1006190 [compost metagenome]
MAACRGGDQHAVDFRVIEQLLWIGVDPLYTQLCGEARGLARCRVGDGGQAGTGNVPGRGLTVEAAHAAGADETQADDFGCTHEMTPFYCCSTTRQQECPRWYNAGSKRHANF